MDADFRGTGMTIGNHPVAYHRAELKKLGATRVIDMATLTGAVSIALCRAYPQLEMIVVDQPPVVAKTAVHIEAAALGVLAHARDVPLEAVARLGAHAERAASKMVDAVLASVIERDPPSPPTREHGGDRAGPVAGPVACERAS